VASTPHLPSAIEPEEETKQVPVAVDERVAAETPAQPPPSPARMSAPSRPYASRPGGLYWDGSRWQWS